jgi:hypothetical protein
MPATRMSFQQTSPLSQSSCNAGLASKPDAARRSYRSTYSTVPPRLARPSDQHRRLRYTAATQCSPVSKPDAAQNTQQSALCLVPPRLARPSDQHRRLRYAAATQCSPVSKPDAARRSYRSTYSTVTPRLARPSSMQRTFSRRDAILPKTSRFILTTRSLGEVGIEGKCLPSGQCREAANDLKMGSLTSVGRDSDPRADQTAGAGGRSPIPKGGRADVTFAPALPCRSGTCPP